LGKSSNLRADAESRYSARNCVYVRDREGENRNSRRIPKKKMTATQGRKIGSDGENKKFQQLRNSRPSAKGKTGSRAFLGRISCFSAGSRKEKHRKTQGADKLKESAHRHRMLTASGADPACCKAMAGGKGFLMFLSPGLGRKRQSPSEGASVRGENKKRTSPNLVI